MRRRNFDIRIQIEAGVHFFGQEKTFWIFQIAGRAAAKYDKIASYIAAAIKILAEDSEDDTDHEDTPTPPTFTLQLFLDSLFFTFFNGEMNQEMNLGFTSRSKVFRLKLGSTSSALENPFHEITWITSNYQAKSGDCRVANSFYVFRLRAKFPKLDPATGVTAREQLSRAVILARF